MLIKLKPGRAIAYRIVFQRREPPELVDGRWVYGFDTWPILFKTKDDAWDHVRAVDTFQNTWPIDQRGRRGKSRYKSVTVERTVIPLARAILKWGPLGDPVV